MTLTATVSAGTGAVAFYDGSELLGYAVLNSGQASLSTSLLASGTRTLTARYAGDVNYGPSISAPLAHRVQPLAVNAVAAPIEIPVYNGSSFAFADLNRDGKLDLIHLDIGGVATRLGNGDGTFQSSPFAFGMQHATSVLRAGDFNADGYPDVIAYGYGKLTLLLGNGDGSVRRSVELTAPDYSAIPSLYAVDIDQDGMTDIAVVGPGLVVYKGKGDGTFEAPVTPITQLLDGGRLSDFNNDGLPDILLLRGGSLPTQVFPGKGDGTFLSPVNTTQPSALIDFATAGDFSGDGKSDAIGVSQTGVYTQLGNGNGSFQIPFFSSPATGTPVPDPNPATGDFDGDGKLDLAFKVNGNPSMAILFGKGDGGFSTVSTLPAPTGLGDTVSADFNGDGRPDIATGGANASFIRIYLGRQDFGVDLTVAHDGAFSSGGGGFYEITLTNRLLSQAPAPATVAFTMPAGMTATYAAGSGWTCSISSCTSTAPLARGTAYTPITLSVSVAAGLSSTTLTPQFTVTFSGASKAFPEPTTIATADGYAGFIEISSCNGISGWALNLNRRNQSITVSLWNGGVQVASVLANALRSDIGTRFTDNGLHGFLIPIPTSLVDGLSHSLEVRFESSAARLDGSPVTLKCGATPSQPSYTGYVDSFSCAAGISGWAADRNRLNQSINVTLWNGATQLASVLANAARSDVGGVLGDNGLHGFTIPIPAAVADGVSRSLQIRYETSGTQITGSPVSVMCGSSGGSGGGGGTTPSYTGYVDAVSCSTGISGWAADRNRPNQSIRVTLWDGATQIASVLAAASRPDVGAVLGDNGGHGFTIPVPAGYADGVSRQLQVRFETSQTQLSSSPATVKCGTSGGGGGGPVVTPSYAGFVDSVSCSAGISGWAVDRNRLNQSIQVSLWDGSTQVASGLANISRPDVGAFVGDNGLHGFAIPIPPAYANGASRSLQVRFESTSTPLGNSPATFTCGTPPSGGGGSAPNYTGWVDATSCSAVSGWAADRNRLNQTINVDLVEGSTVLASVLAGTLRSDVGAALGDNGLHGFSIPTPAALKDGAVHNIQVRYGGTSTAIPNSPQTLQCASTTPQPNYTGYVDRVGCSAISGWAADRNRLNTSIGIEIYLDGSTLLAAIPAGLPRPDVGAVLGDNGNHGFNFIPLQLNDGRPHSITVRPAGSTTPLPGPQAVACP